MLTFLYDKDNNPTKDMDKAVRGTKYLPNDTRIIFDPRKARNAKNIRESLDQNLNTQRTTMQIEGIPDIEQKRVLDSMISTPNPTARDNFEITGIDLAGNQPIWKVPDTGSPPVFIPNNLDLGWIPSVGQYGYMTQPTPDPLGSVKTNEPLYDANGSNLGRTYNIVNPSTEPTPNWLGLSTQPPAQPSMHGEEGFVGSKAIPEWRYPVEDSQIQIPSGSIAIPPSGQWNEAEPKLARYQYNSQEKCPICKPYSNKVFDLNDIVHRPVIPSENLGWTTTHPECKCTWDPIHSTKGKIHTMNDKQQATSSKIKADITRKAKKGELHTVFADGHLSQRTRKTNPMREAIMEVRNTFGWLTDDYLMQARQMAESNGARMYLIKAAEETITDHRAEGEPYRRLLAGDELNALARTAINRGMDVNHNAELRTGATIMDSEYDPVLRQIQMIVMETDPEIIQAIDNGQITAVSINGGSPRSETIEPCINGCTDQTCELCVVPRGVVLAELDDIGMTWVSTSPFMYKGMMIPQATPGVKTTAIQPI